jgi:hypothetical protein
MNHDHDLLFSPSAKAKAMGTIWSSGSTATAIIKVPSTFWSGKCHQQVLLDNNTGMHVPFTRTAKTHGARHVATGPRNTSLWCPQTISS